MTDAFKIRVPRAEDIPAMHALRLSVQENRLSDPSRIGQGDYVPFVERGAAWVAESRAQLLGFAAVDQATASVWALFVDPRAAGSGVGRALHERMLSWARQQQLPKLTLTTAPETRAERFYRTAGWAEIGRVANGEIIFERRP